MELRERIAGLMPQAQQELSELVAIRSVADARQFPPEECAAAAQWLLGKFKEVGFSDVHLAETADGSQAVVGSRSGADSTAPTVLLYSHYDVQPPLDESAWRTPPFQLTEVDGRWYGRGAADCKGNIVVHLMALRALGDDVPVNLKLVFEGSEEQGTGGLEDFVPKNADLLRADAILVCDTGNAAVGHPAATVSLRGVINAVVTVKALESEMHRECSAAQPPMRWLRLLRCWQRFAMNRAIRQSGAWITPRLGRVSRIHLSSSGPTPGCSMVSPFWEMAASVTCSGRVRR
jgi:acetylornithine deacetylase/succinyl-diaminopimelate desuccinylase-like protein